MKNSMIVLALFSLVAFPGKAQDKIAEPSTGKLFDSRVTFRYDAIDYVQQLTGVAVRKKLVFKVYGMAHYMQEPPVSTKEAAFDAILKDGKAKQIVMTVVRDVERQKIQDAYRDGFKENTTDEDLKKLQPMIELFVGFFQVDVKENDQFILHWLPGGIIIATVQGEQKPPIKDVLFARTLWSIWFGEDSIVHRDDLVSRIVK